MKLQHSGSFDGVAEVLTTEERADLIGAKAAVQTFLFPPPSARCGCPRCQAEQETVALERAAMKLAAERTLAIMEGRATPADLVDEDDRGLGKTVSDEARPSSSLCYFCGRTDLPTQMRSIARADGTVQEINACFECRMRHFGEDGV